MQILARKEQEQLVLTFEKDYGKLVMEFNQGIEKESVVSHARKLLSQIKMAATPSYFEDDMLECLDGISTSIMNVVLH